MKKLLLTASMALLLGGSMSGWASQPAPTDKLVLNIAAQPVGDALNELARQTGLQVVLYSDVGEGVRAPAVIGTYTAEAALQRLLANSNLRYKFLDSRTVTIQGKGEDAALSPQGRRITGAEEGGTLRLAQVSSDSAQSNASAAGQSAQEKAQAAGSGENAQGPKLDEIIVTARKREEKLLDVPASIGIISKDDIERKGLVHSADYLRGVAGVSQVESGSGGQAIVIRGVVTDILAQNFYSGPTTSTYFGETPTTNSGGLSASNVDIKLVDIERVEVLRGPQGTAFGSASLGGAVRTIPVAPKLDRFEGKLASGYSQTSGNGGRNYMFQGVGNVPLIGDKLAIRAVAYAFSDSGYYTNRAGSDTAFQSRILGGVGTFATDEEEVGSYYSAGGRIAARFQASDALRFTLSYLTQKNEMDGEAVANSGKYEQTILRVAPEHVRRGQTGGLADAQIDIGNAVVEYDFGWADLLATYSHITSLGSTVYGNTLYAASLPYPVSQDVENPHREHSAEIRLATKLGGAWDFLVGLYEEKLDDAYLLPDSIWFGNPAANIYIPGSRTVGGQIQRRDEKQRAAFGEVSWQFLPGFTLSGGVRAYSYDRSLEAQGTGAFFFPFVRQESDATGTTYRANLSYKPGDNALLYTGWSQGFRLGQPQRGVPTSTICDGDGDGVIDGTNTTLASTRVLNSDTVDNYELGGKFATSGRRLMVDAAVFRTEWSGLPVRVTPNSVLCSFTYLANAGKALSDGIELQANFQATEALRVDFGGSYVHARLTQDVPVQGFKAGDRLPGSPNVNGNLGVQYSFSLAGHAASVRTDAIYVGSFYGNILESLNTKTDAYVKLDASARMAFDNLSFDLYVRNLTNEDAFTYRSILTFTNDLFGYRLRPRTVGVQINYDFK